MNQQQMPVTNMSFPQGQAQEMPGFGMEQYEYPAVTIRNNQIDQAVAATYRAIEHTRNQMRLAAEAHAGLEVERMRRAEVAGTQQVNEYGGTSQPTPYSPVEKLQTLDDLGYNRTLDLRDEDPVNPTIWTDAVQSGALDTIPQEAFDYQFNQIVEQLDADTITPVADSEINEKEQFEADARHKVEQALLGLN